MLALAQAVGARQLPSLGSWPPDLAALASRLTPRDDVFEAEARPPVPLRFFFRSDAGSAADRLIPTTQASLRWFSEWFGPFPHASLAVIDLPWNGGVAGASYPGVVATRTRWLSPVRDLTAERSLVAAIGRQYWTGPGAASAPASWFQEGLVLYSGTRGIHDALENRNFATVRYFGGFVPFAIRSIMWSPPQRQVRPRLRHFPEVDDPAAADWRASPAGPDGDAQRAALAFHTLERYLGWPAFQQALAELYEHRHATGLTPQALADVLTRQRGVDMGWFFAEAFRPGARFDYAVESLTSEPATADPSRYRTVVTVRRLGDGVFAGTSAPGSGAAGRALPVLVRFDDGEEIVDYWDGRAETQVLSYESRVRATSATIDPDLTLLLDADRRNNSRTLRAAVNPMGMRLVLHWVAWLQDLMLSSTSLV